MVHCLCSGWSAVARALPEAIPVHHWPAFLAVVCLGLIQVTLTYYSSRLTIEPMHVTSAARRRHRQVYAAMLVGFVCLTLLLAKLNDTNQYQSEVMVEHEKAKQERLQTQLQQTLNAVLSSQTELQQIRQAVDAHPPGAERSGMLNAIDQIERNLHQQTESMQRVIP